MLSPCTGQVAHALLTRPPLGCPMIRPKLPRRDIPVRLACVRHAASVHPEPGSNSHFHLSFPVTTGFTVFRLYHHSLPFWGSLLLIPFSEFSFWQSVPLSGPFLPGIFRVALLFICQGSFRASTCPGPMSLLFPCCCLSLRRNSVIISCIFLFVNSFFYFFKSFFRFNVVSRDRII